MQFTRKHQSLLPILGLAWSVFGAAANLHGQSFASFPAGDDVTTSLGQFQIVLDQAWVKLFDDIMANSPLADTPATRRLKIYRHGGIFTSPTLYDPTTVIGRSDWFLSGAPQDAGGALAGQAPGRTYIQDSQLPLRPTWSASSNGVRELHTFIKSLFLTDSFTTRVGFSVKAGMQAPNRPVSAGEVEAGSATSDFPARSFFNVFVQVDLPAGGILPAIQLVNVDPLLVEQTNLLSFPPRIVYQHGNSTAVSMYFNTDVTLPDPRGGTDIHVTRGTLFGQLTLAGHGVGFGPAETEAFQTEIENETERSMPINPTPIPTVRIEDFSPDYNVAPPTLLASHLAADGAFVFTVTNVTANATDYLQLSTNLSSGNWQIISTNLHAGSSFIFIDPGTSNSPRRFYRWIRIP